jgi:two-component system CheB/CheR fusion protein
MPSAKSISSQNNNRHHVIGIGASAGGLEPIHLLFDNMPEQTNFSFIIIQHLSPDHKSLMRDLLAKHTNMKVVEAVDKMKLEPNVIYLIPSKKTMTLQDDTLLLRDKEVSQVPNNAIDTFFESLAQAKGSDAIGIILSGSGTDGTRGIEAIKQRGGIVVVQDPATADFNSMPISALNTGLADLITSPELMAGELIDYLKDPCAPHLLGLTNEEDEQLVDEIIRLIKEVTHRDFSSYKRPTICRRLAKRLSEKGYKTLRSYYDHLRENTEEVNSLVKEFLINVTRFFRDPEAFEEIRNKVIPTIIANKPIEEGIKVWVVACSSGEEAYSLAILFHEYLQTASLNNNVKIFATDIDNDALQIASLGIYPDTIAQDISAERLSKYFTKEGDTYKVLPSLRKMVVFAHHDVIKDPPFSRLDVISCRNVLIYMNNTLQKQVLRAFHFAINEGGYLFLGVSENIGVLKDSMREISKKWKLYKCVNKHKLMNQDILFKPMSASSIVRKDISRKKNAFTHLDEIFRDTITEEYPYAGVLIDESLEVKHAIGRFKDFITFPDDNFTYNILKLVPDDLSIPLSICIRKAIYENDKIVMREVKVSRQKESRKVTVIVKPYLRQQEYQQSFLFVVFYQENGQSQHSNALQEKSSPPEQMRSLEKELQETKENLQTLIEELETANEELMTSNEEMISTNEELQSTNEELQSLNEELHTVSVEHQLRIKELIELNDDLNNYFNNSEVGQVLVDRHMILKRFSPAVVSLVNLIETDIGRSLYDITNNIRSTDLLKDIQQVLSTNRSLKKEVVTGHDKIYLMKISPYVKQDRSYDGVVVNFTDVTEIKNLSSILIGVLDSSPNGIIAQLAVRGDDGRIADFEFIIVNRTAEAIFQVGDQTSLTGHRFLGIFPKDSEIFTRHINTAESGREDKFEYYHPSHQQWFEVAIVKMRDGVVSTFTDTTQKKKAADIISKNYEELKHTSGQLKDSNLKLEKSNMDLLQFASVASHDLKEPLRKILTFSNFLSTKAKDKLEPNEKNYLEKITLASNRMQMLIEDVLTLSKLSNTGTPFVPTDLNSLLEKIVDDLEITIAEKKTRIEIQDLPIIDAVPGQMRQLFQNLISNALKFNEKPSPVIKIYQVDPHGVHEEGVDLTNPEDFVCIMVEDDGIGFDEQFKEKIFGIFQRLNPSQFEGTGIGLAICKKIVDNHRGYIGVKSKIGEGSTFIILLPKKHADTVDIQYAAETIPNQASR